MDFHDKGFRKESVHGWYEQQDWLQQEKPLLVFGRVHDLSWKRKNWFYHSVLSLSRTIEASLGPMDYRDVSICVSKVYCRETAEIKE